MNGFKWLSSGLGHQALRLPFRKLGREEFSSAPMTQEGLGQAEMNIPAAKPNFWSTYVEGL
uniref:Uncharacterized protein n=1 Tax=Pseudomonas fluorescens (strain SBW25) TaxID=216595 RepID=A0A0G4E505_PSEFS|nr:hypothetical protein PQBR57_0357 [Pseudomonas fluorescens SBW25]